MAGCEDKVEYRVGCDFEPEESFLVIIDESDRIMFGSPKTFANFIENKFCICFTATPSNCDQQGVEAEVIKALGFKQYNYVFEQPSAVNLLIKLTPTEVTNAECAVGTLSLVAMFAAPHSLFLTKRKLTTTTIHLMFHHTRRNYERNLQS